MSNEPSPFTPAEYDNLTAFHAAHAAMLKPERVTVAPLTLALEPITEFFRDILDDERAAVAQRISAELATNVLFTTHNADGDVLPLLTSPSFGPLRFRQEHRAFEDVARRLYAGWTQEHPDVPDLAAAATYFGYALILDVNIFYHDKKNPPCADDVVYSAVQRELCRIFRYSPLQIVDHSVKRWESALIGGIQGIGACLRLKEVTA